MVGGGILFSFFNLKAAVVDTVKMYSPSMKKEIKAVVIKPDTYDSKKTFPVVYLLHGHGGNYEDWIGKAPEISHCADQLGLMIVCPDGGFNSWYFDSPENPDIRYETYISKELVPWIDKNYKTIISPKGRAITGLSMGGHGALYLAFKHQNIFGAAGSMSGGVDLTPFPDNWEISEKLGAYKEHPERWREHSVIHLVHLLNPYGLQLIIDCGIDDFFYSVNINLHKKLMESNIPHDFISRPGGHTWEYWKNSIQYQLLFMHLFFADNNTLQKE